MVVKNHNFTAQYNLIFKARITITTQHNRFFFGTFDIFESVKIVMSTISQKFQIVIIIISQHNTTFSSLFYDSDNSLILH